MLRRLLVAVALVAVVASSAVATDDTPEGQAAKRTKIRELLELTGIPDLADQIVQGTVGPLRQAMPQVPPEWWDGFTEGIDAEELLTLVTPIHEKHLTVAELNALVAFYRTPEGQSVLSKLPLIGQESMMVGQMWSRQLADDLVAALEAAGHQVPQDFRP